VSNLQDLSLSVMTVVGLVGGLQFYLMSQTGNAFTIGAGSVVTKDGPPFFVAVGSPARVIKKVSPVPDV
jgi:carbonic anhydrase/acetyltransferase-like protein (isoleucine patch superfamily)